MSRRRKRRYTRKRPKKAKKLDMNRIKDFKWQLGLILKDLPDSVRGSIKGSIYAKASRVGLREAKEYIMKKEKEGVISEKMGKRVVKLLYRYYRYRS
ncbi:MAG: hypothetical protein U9N35_08895 [Euryarchaeota archaeon]|nr:hypothetical protein [Euryarchaeota archaeon]